ncbi:hypothetical protein GALMADRAFT_73233 [Galerina marginata CBS 339.88]|uniref:VOC domain-containing protein n=1 Tax=Galerina marginata (strain CBS 339.88) TaxID=685588 RepID=A0A067SRX5_GALM3|nr:hypothetical protein GALMADRAFT_73233 [Galerina marginata CBS 339.88]
MPLHHLGIDVRDLKEAREFYLAALKPLGYKVKMTFHDGEVIGMGAGFAPDFWLTGPNKPSPDGSEKPKEKTGFIHLAFAASNREQVRKFYDAAIAAGGKCNGPPGVRPEYLSIYYGAFVLDPEGRNIEAVCIKPAFLAEPWGVVGWLATSGILAAVGSGVAKWQGWF